MRKEYFANIEYNKKKRKNSIVLSIILAFMLLLMAATFAVNGDYLFAAIFAILLVIPIFAIPSGFKNYPVHNKPILVIEDDSVTANGKTYKLKDIKRVVVLIELPSTKIDKDDLKTLDYLRENMPEDEFYGTFDIYYKGDKKTEIEYTTIDHVVDALYAMAEIGLKDYKLKFTIKKNTVINECDLRKCKEVLAKENSLDKVSKKKRNRQLL